MHQRVLGSEPTQASVDFYAEARQILTLSGVRVGSAGKILTASLQGRKMIMHIPLLTLARLFHSLFIMCMFSCTRCSYFDYVQRLCSLFLLSGVLFSLSFEHSRLPAM